MPGRVSPRAAAGWLALVTARRAAAPPAAPRQGTPHEARPEHALDPLDAVVPGASQIVSLYGIMEKKYDLT